MNFSYYCNTIYFIIIINEEIFVVTSDKHKTETYITVKPI